MALTSTGAVLTWRSASAAGRRGSLEELAEQIESGEMVHGVNPLWLQVRGLVGAEAGLWVLRRVCGC